MSTITFDKDKYLIYGFEKEGSHIIPPHYQPKQFNGEGILWLLPRDKTGNSKMLECGAYSVKTGLKNVTITFEGEISEKEYPPIPCCDFFGNELIFDLPQKEIFEKTFGEFYWNNQLNQIAERTFLRDKEDIREGYVLSTLNTKAYAGTYPAVDHEFHMKGRYAVGGKAEAELIKRMLQLQIKIMREDERGMYRNVCAIQPNRDREYDVWRSTIDGTVTAQMFRITANIEFVEGVYNYYSLTKDIDFLTEFIEDIEKNCSYIEHYITADNLLDSHVHFEDQVMKDFAVLQSQLFASNSFGLMSKIEMLLGRNDKAEHYLSLKNKLGEAAMRPFPQGFWDNESNRFIDWIDSKGEKHDRIHLLANELPELFGFASEEQAEASRRVIEENKGVFDKFPSYVAAKIEDYTPSEIGDGGPYDLCAAGRYWCWDAEYIAYKEDGEKLLRQLLQVCNQAEIDSYYMGERYDMNYVYYNTGKDAKRNWHGASLYYEYPNVWMYAFICKYLGISRGFDCDFVLKPLFENGRVRLQQIGIEFEVKDGKITEIKNLSGRTLKIKTGNSDTITEI